MLHSPHPATEGLAGLTWCSSILQVKGRCTSMRVLGTIVFLSWALGCLPASSPFVNSKNFKFQFFSCSFLYSVLVFIFGTFLHIFVHQSTTLFGEISQALHINLIACMVTEFIQSTVARSIGIIHCARIVEFVKSVRDVKEFSRKFSLKDGVNINNKGRMGPRIATYLMLAAATILQLVMAIKYFNFFIEPTSAKGIGMMFRTPFLKVVGFTICAISMVVGIATITIAMWLVVGMADALLDVHGDFFRCVIASLKEPSMHVATGPQGVAVLHYNFLKMKSCFGMYARITGLYLLVTITWFLAGVIYSTHALIWPHDGITDLTSFLHTVLGLLILIIPGQLLQSQVSL